MGILIQRKVEIDFLFFTAKLRDAQPGSFLAMYIHIHLVVVSLTMVGIRVAHMLSGVPCTRTSLLTQPGLAGKIRELAYACL